MSITALTVNQLKQNNYAVQASSKVRTMYKQLFLIVTQQLTDFRLP